MGAPATLPANFDQWDAPKGGPPTTLPASFSGWDEQKSNTPPPKPAIPGFWDTLSREGKALTGTIAGVPASVYHAFADPPTKEETDKFGGPDQVNGEKRVGLGVYRMTTAPAEVAGKFYWDAAHGKYGDASAVESAMLDVAPEAIGQSGGTVIAGKLAQSAPAAISAAVDKAPAIASAAGDIGAAAVRGAAKGTNFALAAAPRAVGASVGGAIGAATEIPHGTAIGAGLGAIAGERLLPRLRIPGEDFGLAKPVFSDTPLGPATPAPEVLQANALSKGGSAPPPDPSAALASIPVRPLAELPSKAVHQAVGELGPNATIATLTERANKIAQLGELLNKGLGGKGLQPNVPLRAQTGVVTPNESLPQGHIPVDSSALKSYKYDPTTHEFESVTSSGAHYIHGDVSPEQAAAFEAADSKGKAWNDLRQNSTLVAKVVNGKRVPVRPLISEANEIDEDEWEAGHAIGTGVEGSTK